MLSVIIPSKNEKYLDATILDVLKNSRGDIEVIAILDGYDTKRIDDPRVKYITLEKSDSNHKRQGVNEAVRQSKGEYVMALDAHCMVAEGFDLQLIKDHQPNWVQVPRRHRLDAENWCIQDQRDGRPPIDYEYLMWQGMLDNAFHGYKWDSRTLDRKDILIDDILTMQGSTWFMTKEWYNKCGFMDIRYQGWGQEAEEISFTTWKNGGRVVVNKNTWYAHLHKGKKYGRMYRLNYEENKLSYQYAHQLWIVENKEFFISLIEKFWPIPNWPSNWKELVWTS
jgi:glycosyltransferase involved in cell wall biosynthesis